MKSDRAALTGPSSTRAAAGAGLRRPHQSLCEARPNCQCATSMGDARMSQRPCGPIANQEVRGHGRCGLRARENATDGNSLRFKLLPATFITTPNSVLCQANQCGTMRLITHFPRRPRPSLASRSIRPRSMTRRRGQGETFRARGQVAIGCTASMARDDDRRFSSSGGGRRRGPGRPDR